MDEAAVPSAPAAAAAAVLELDSDEDAAVVPKEMCVPPAELEAEFADEPATDPEQAEKEEKEDPERLHKDEGPFPSLPPFGNPAPSDARRKVLDKMKAQAGEASDRGEINQAIEKYTEVIRTGGASASMLATRAHLLMKQGRPCAAIRDCCVALMMNPDCAKALHIRGLAHRKLGHWQRAHRDLSEAQKMDFSDDSVAIHVFVAKKLGISAQSVGTRVYPSDGARKSLEVPAPAAGSAAVLELDSDEDASPVPKEMCVPAAELEAEFADEPVADPVQAEKEENEDPERLLKDEGPYPSLPPFGNPEPSDARRKVLERMKKQAGEALERGDINQAVEKYTEAIRTGGASASMLATRAALLMKQRRPCAAIRDCCVALMMNPDCGKALHIRGLAHRKLGHWKRAHRDLSEAQKMDFSDDSVSVHVFVAKKLGISPQSVGTRVYTSDGARKTLEPKFAPEVKGKDEKEKKRKKSSSSSLLRVGQAVRLGGLLKAPQLNGKRGIIQKVNDKDPDRWDVEVRMDRGRVEIKSIRQENILIVRSTDAKAWQNEEMLFADERRKRERDEKRWLDEEERQRRLSAKSSASQSNAFPDMDIAEKLEAEMSGLPLDQKSMNLLRRLSGKDALDLLHQAGLDAVGGNLNQYVKIKVRQRLGDPDSEDEEETKRRAEQAVKAAAAVAASVEARVAAEAKREAAAAAERRKRKEEEERNRYNPEDSASESESDDEDFDLLQPEMEDPPPPGFLAESLDDETNDRIASLKHEAAIASESNSPLEALECFNKVMLAGAASAMNLAKRAEILLKLSRPKAAIQDCTAAIKLNPDSGKAHRVRGIANRKLGKYVEAYEDLVESQRLDYDEGVVAIFQFVKGKATKKKKNAPKRARTS